jgi:hypothetical protein
MNKPSLWHNLLVILFALIILPPLGLYLLWKSHRELQDKIYMTIVFAVVFIGASALLVHSGVLQRYDEPIGGYDIATDQLGHYKNPRILPFENRVFTAVVGQLRKLGSNNKAISVDIESLEDIQPGYKAYQIVGDEFGIPPEDVEQIYLKVSSHLAKNTK